LGVTGGRKLRSVIFIIIESGIALFAIQLARLVLALSPTTAEFNPYNLIICIHEMLNVSTTIRSITVTLYLTNDINLTRA
jgi:hypothetical protein